MAAPREPAGTGASRCGELAPLGLRGAARLAKGSTRARYVEDTDRHRLAVDHDIDRMPAVLRSASGMHRQGCRNGESGHRRWAVARPEAECSHQRYTVLGMAKPSQRQEIDVTFDGEVLRPHEPLELEPNRTYRIQIEAADSKPKSENSLLRILDLARDFGLPDLADQHDHYLYATPKK